MTEAQMAETVLMEYNPWWEGEDKPQKMLVQNREDIEKLENYIQKNNFSL